MNDFLKCYSDYECLLSNCPYEDVYGKNFIANAYRLLDSTPDRRFVTPALEEVLLRNVSVVSPPDVQEVAHICDKVLITEKLRSVSVISPPFVQEVKHACDKVSFAEKLRNVSVVSPPDVQEVAHHFDKVSFAAVEKGKVQFVRIKYSCLEPSYSTEPSEELAIYFEKNLQRFTQSILHSFEHLRTWSKEFKRRVEELELKDCMSTRLADNRIFLRFFWMYFSFLDFNFVVLLVGLMLYFLIVLMVILGFFFGVSRISILDGWECNCQNAVNLSFSFTFVFIVSFVLRFIV